MTSKSAGNKKFTPENIIFTTLNTTLLVVFSAILIYPLWNTLAISLNDGLDAVKGGIYFWPRKFSLSNYSVVLHMDTIVNSFFMSVAKTVVVTVTNILFTSLLAYGLSRNEYLFRRPDHQGLRYPFPACTLRTLRQSGAGYGTPPALHLHRLRPRRGYPDPGEINFSGINFSE